MKVDLLHPHTWTMAVNKVQGLGTIRLSAKSSTNAITWDYDMTPAEALALAQMLEETARGATEFVAS